MTMTHEVDRGVGFHFRLPVTLAVTQALLVRVGNWRFAFRSRSIERLIRMPSRDITDVGGLPGIEVDGVQGAIDFSRPATGT